MKSRMCTAICLVVSIVATISITREVHAQKPNDDAVKVHPGHEVLQRFVGTWDLKSTYRPAKWQPHGAELTGQESTVWALKNRVILIRDFSQPDGRKALYISTYDAEQDAFPFWSFDSQGLMGAQWLLKWNSEAQATIGRSTDAPPNWTSGGQNRFPDNNTMLVSFWMRDENGTLLMDGAGRKDRLPADRAQAIVAEWKQQKPGSDLPAELQVLEQMAGTWDTVSIQKPAEWTPEGGRLTATVTREWILDGRFLMDTSLHADGQESLALFGYDPERKMYRTWWFNSEGQHNTSQGTWNKAAQTLSSVSELDDGKTMRSSVRFAGPDQEEWQFKVTDAAGKVYLDMHITATRTKK